MDLEIAHRTIMDTVRTATEPLGLALIPAGEPWPEKVRRPSDLGLKPSMCQWTNFARRERVAVGLKADDIACAPCQVAFGLKVLTDPTALGSFLFGMGYIGSIEKAAPMLEQIPLLPPGAYQGIIAFPLDLAPCAPDVVWVYGSPAQISHLVIGLIHEQGRPIPSNTGLGLTCRDGFADKPRIMIPGRGERLMGCTGESELFLALPASMLGDLVRGLKATHDKGITAPIVGPAPQDMPPLEPMRIMAEALVSP